MEFYIFNFSKFNFFFIFSKFWIFFEILHFWNLSNCCKPYYQTPLIILKLGLAKSLHQSSTLFEPTHHEDLGIGFVITRGILFKAHSNMNITHLSILLLFFSFFFFPLPLLLIESFESESENVWIPDDLSFSSCKKWSIVNIAQKTGKSIGEMFV